MSQSTDQACNVFVSCLMDCTCGPVVRHLINYLKSDGIGAVLGRVEIRPGEPMDATLRRSIKDCDIYVIVFTERYATSNSRLWEVAAIAEAAAEDTAKRILPVFYGVTAEDVKLRTDKYNTQLGRHTTSESVVTIEEWRNALQRTAQILGLNRPISDADLCQEIRGRVRELIREKDQSVVTLKATITGCPKLLSLNYLGLGFTRTFLTLENVGITRLELQSLSENLTEKITFRSCHNLAEASLEQLKSLKVVEIEGCTSIERLSDVGSAGKLEELSVANCQNLKVIQGLEEVLGSLKILNITNCGSLESKSMGSKLLKIRGDPRSISSGGNIQSSFDEESERSNSSPTPSSIISTSADHDEAKVEMHRLESSPGASSSTSLAETTQQEDAEWTIVELNQLIELD